MFVRDEMPLDVGFSVARDRLAKLHAWFPGASSDAYSQGMSGLIRVGPLGTGVGISRLVEVRLLGLTEQDNRAGLALRWEACGLGGRLFPVLDADLVLIPTGDDAALLTLAGAYRPPFGGAGAELDREILHKVAEATVANFLKRIAAAIMSAPPIPTRGLDAAEPAGG